MISFINSLFDYFSGNAVFINKLIIRERTDSCGIRSLGDAKILFNFEWPKECPVTNSELLHHYYDLRVVYFISAGFITIFVSFIFNKDYNYVL